MQTKERQLKYQERRDKDKYGSGLKYTGFIIERKPQMHLKVEAEFLECSLCEFSCVQVGGIIVSVEDDELINLWLTLGVLRDSLVFM